MPETLWEHMCSICAAFLLSYSDVSTSESIDAFSVFSPLLINAFSLVLSEKVTNSTCLQALLGCFSYYGALANPRNLGTQLLPILETKFGTPSVAEFINCWINSVPIIVFLNDIAAIIY